MLEAVVEKMKGNLSAHMLLLRSNGTGRVFMTPNVPPRKMQSPRVPFTLTGKLCGTESLGQSATISAVGGRSSSMRHDQMGKQIRQ